MARRIIANPRDDKQQRRAEIAAGAADPRLGGLLALAHLLAPAHLAPQLAADLECAFTAPTQYAATHPRLARVKPAILPWVALVDELTTAKIISRVDWRGTRQEVEEGITELAKRFRPSVEVALKPADRAVSWDFLAAAGTALHAHQLRLVCIDEDSDSFPVFVVPADDLDELQRLVAQAAYAKISVLGERGSLPRA